MINDYKNNTRANSINPNNPYYSYFQYLPLRSKTSYTGAQLTSYLNNKANSSESKLNNTGDIFVKYQNQYGVNALMAASFAALELSLINILVLFIVMKNWMRLLKL